MILGTKVQTYVDDKLVVKRVIRQKNEDCYILNNIETGDTESISKQDLIDKYVMLTPDAFINIMITTEHIDGMEDIKDVYFCVSRAADVKEWPPALVLRQNVYSSFKGIGGLDIYVGECRTIVNSVKDDIETMMSFSDIDSKYSVSSYIDDSLDDILECVSNRFKKSINTTLSIIRRSLSNIGVEVKGMCDTVEQLLEENDFMGNYKSIFNIVQIDFPIIIDKRSYNADGDIVLNNKQKSRIESMLNRHIKDIKIIEYDKDLDISKIVSKQHIVVSDSENKIYLIAYDTDGYICNDEGDKQIISSMIK